MHVCIVGAGAAGWIAYHYLKKHQKISKITVIGSPTIPKIGVGESTTLVFKHFVETYLGLKDKELEKFLIDIDAAFKYGVSYENWGPNTFLHHFINPNFTDPQYTYFLGNKNVNDKHNDLAVPLTDEIYTNNIYLDESYQHFSFHFDANKFIKTMHSLSINEKKINYIEDTVIDLEYTDSKAKTVILESGNKISADYFISCIGQTAFNQKVFKQEYTSYNDILLTNKALFFPLQYKDNVKEFHPYTVARTMPNGWRWITPTLSRIGTGYVFSTNYISVDQAIDEFRKDLGDNTVEPFTVDFYPRRVNKVFQLNTCTLGMASGFLEPLDAPGLTLIFNSLEKLSLLFNISDPNKIKVIDEFNDSSKMAFDFWCSFILHQYKTCHRNDTQFWIDHKNVKFAFYDEITKELFETKKSRLQLKTFSNKILEPWMFYNTTSGKDISWTVNMKTHVTPHKEKVVIDKTHLINHRHYFNKISDC